MGDQPNISQILAALAQRPPSNAPPGHPHGLPQVPGPPNLPPHQHPPPQAYQAPYPQPYHPPPSLPPPSHTGSIDLTNVKPVSTGSVDFSDPRSRSSMITPYSDPQRGVDYRNTGSSYRPSRSRSRSPRRREGPRDAYNSYRDDRRGDFRQPAPHVREHSPMADAGRARSGNQVPLPDYGAGRAGAIDDNSEVISINSSLVGLIIGRQGENLRRVEIETRTRVQFVTPPDAGVLERECRITGTASAREHAKSEINRIIQESGKAGGISSGRAPPPSDRDLGGPMRVQAPSQPPPRANDDMTQMMVPNRTVGLIIGKGGETIRDLQLRSGCHVNILGEERSVNGFRPVNLIGSYDAANKAKELITQIVDSDASATGNVPPSFREGKPDGRVGSGIDNDRSTNRMFVPSEAVGMIIGKGGETVKEMQHATGCKINVTPASGRDVEREIGLVGSRESIERAKYAINERVRMVQEKNRPMNAMPRGPPPGGDQQYNQRQVFDQQSTQPQAGQPDPYADYGGYQNYVALWYSSLQANQGQPDSQAPGAPGS